MELINRWTELDPNKFGQFRVLARQCSDPVIRSLLNDLFFHVIPNHDYFRQKLDFKIAVIGIQGILAQYLQDSEWPLVMNQNYFHDFLSAIPVFSTIPPSIQIQLFGRVMKEQQYLIALSLMETVDPHLLIDYFPQVFELLSTNQQISLKMMTTIFSRDFPPEIKCQLLRKCSLHSSITELEDHSIPEMALLVGKCVQTLPDTELLLSFAELASYCLLSRDALSIYWLSKYFKKAISLNPSLGLKIRPQILNGIHQAIADLNVDSDQMIQWHMAMLSAVINANGDECFADFLQMFSTDLSLSQSSTLLTALYPFFGKHKEMISDFLSCFEFLLADFVDDPFYAVAISNYGSIVIDHIAEEEEEEMDAIFLVRLFLGCGNSILSFLDSLDSITQERIESVISYLTDHFGDILVEVLEIQQIILRFVSSCRPFLMRISSQLLGLTPIAIRGPAYNEFVSVCGQIPVEASLSFIEKMIVNEFDITGVVSFLSLLLPDILDYYSQEFIRASFAVLGCHAIKMIGPYLHSITDEESLIEMLQFADAFGDLPDEVLISMIDHFIGVCSKLGFIDATQSEEETIKAVLMNNTVTTMMQYIDRLDQNKALSFIFSVAIESQGLNKDTYKAVLAKMPDILNSEKSLLIFEYRQTFDKAVLYIRQNKKSVRSIRDFFHFFADLQEFLWQNMSDYELRLQSFRNVLQEEELAVLLSCAKGRTPSVKLLQTIVAHSR